MLRLWDGRQIAAGGGHLTHTPPPFHLSAPDRARSATSAAIAGSTPSCCRPGQALLRSCHHVSEATRAAVGQAADQADRGLGCAPRARCDKTGQGSINHTQTPPTRHVLFVG